MSDAVRSTLTVPERRCLQAHARRALEGVDRNRSAREGESVWHTDHPPTWTPDTLNGLEARGLILVREEWKDNFVHITEAGFAALEEKTAWYEHEDAMEKLRERGE